MSRPLVHRHEALDDVDEAYAWYEQQLAGFGDEFLIALRDAVDLIAANPLGYGIVYRGTRACLMHRFPYVVYYFVEPTQIVVVAVQHGRRHPRPWRSRV